MTIKLDCNLFRDVQKNLQESKERFNYKELIYLLLHEWCIQLQVVRLNFVTGDPLDPPALIKGNRCFTENRKRRSTTPAKFPLLVSPVLTSAHKIRQTEDGPFIWNLPPLARHRQE